MVTMFLSFMTSRTGIVLTIFLSLFAWHKIDKGSAVRKAVMEYVADVELSAAEAEAKVLRERAEKAEAANDELAEQIAAAEEEVRDVEAAFAKYRQSVATDGLPAVDRGLLDVLRAD